jgi:predicted nucleic acid-binding protein
MIGHIILDSGPLGLLFQRSDVKLAEDCRAWLRGHLARGVRVFVPEIVDYELRRELLRLNLAKAVADLDTFNALAVGRFVPLATPVLQHAASLWAIFRQKGILTADRHALDIDVILAAQALSLGLADNDSVVATSNVTHLARFVPAKEWSAI